MPRQAVPLVVLALGLCGCTRQGLVAPVEPTSAGGPGGATLSAAQVAPAAAPDLEVSYISPAGPQAEPPRQVVVIFNQPMVAMTAAAAQNASVPVELDPPVATRAHWVGTRVAVLEPVEPLTLATEYRVRVPAGVSSMVGRKLAGEATATFETPRPAVARIWPEEGHEDCEASQIFLVEMNQPVDADRLARLVTFRTGRGVVPALVRAPAPDELKMAARQLGAWLKDASAAAGTFFLVRPTRPLPLDSRFTLSVAAGLIGRQGPLPSSVAVEKGYRTFGPLRVVGTGCGTQCSPADPWEATVRFSNPVGSLEFRRKVLRDREVQDEGPGWFSPEHRAIDRPQAGRAYTVVLPADLADSHGQTLGSEVVVRYAFGHWPPAFEDWAGGGVMEANGPRRYGFSVRNVARVTGQAAFVPRDRVARTLTALRADIPPGLGRIGLKAESVDIEATGPVDRLHTAALDLDPFLGDRTGMVAYHLRAEGAWGGDLGVVRAGVIQVTDLALTAKVSPEGTLLWVTRLSTGQPVADARIEVRADDDNVLWTGVSSRDGRADAPGVDALARMLPPAGGSPGAAGEESGGWAPDPDTMARRRLFAVAWTQGDTTVLRFDDARLVWPESPSVDGDGAGEYEDYGAGERWRSHVVLDRDVYRDGETVRMKGWVRRMTGRGPSRVPGGTATVEVLGPQADEESVPIARTPVFFDDFGSFFVSWLIPPGAPHGPYTVRVEVPGEPAVDAATFQVTFFEPPEFNVTAGLDRKDYVRGDSATGSVRASYYFGAPMSDAPVSWSFFMEPVAYAPPGMPGWRFDDPFESGTGSEQSPDERLGGGDEARLDATGSGTRTHRLVPPFRSPARLTFEAEVQDTSGRTVAGRATATIHPAEFYLGTRIQGWVVDAGRPVEVGIAAVDPHGNPAATRTASASLVRREWQTVRRKGVGDAWQVVSEPLDVPVDDRRVELSGGRATVTFTPPDPGLYRVRVTSTDARGNPVRSGVSFFAVGEGRAAWQRPTDSRVQLMPDRPSYAPGDKARVLVQSPFERGHALVTVERQGVLWQGVFAMEGNASTIEVPMLPEFEPNVTVGVVVVRGRLPAPPDGPGPEDLEAPAVRVGSLKLRVDPGENRLSVAVRPAAPDYRPGQDVEATIEVRDRAGRPSRAQVLVFAVDAAVLDLTGYVLRDPFDTFFAAQPSLVLTGDSRDFLIRRLVLGEKSEPGGDGGADLTRKDFVALAYWEPDARTGDDGRVTVRFRAPDNLTRFRVMAVATTGEARFGTASADFTVSRPLVLRPALPPFVEAGDTFRMHVAVHGSPGVTGEASVSVEATGAISLKSPAEARVQAGEGRPVEATFDMMALSPGEASIRVSGTLAGERDAVLVKVPVRRRARIETVASSGAATTEVRETVMPPPGVAPDAGGLRVSVAPTALVGLDQAARFLVRYPYGCLEQRMSATLPDIYLEDLAATFGFPAGTEGDLRKSVEDSLSRIGQYQRPDGGFGFWPGGRDPSDLHLSAWTVYVAGLAASRGFSVDKSVIAKAVEYLDHALRTPGDQKPGPDEAAFATFVLADLGRPAGDLVTLMAGDRARLSRAGKAWLAAAASRDAATATTASALMTEVLDGAVVKGDEAAIPDTGTSFAADLSSGDVATTAAVLIAGSRIAPSHPLMPRFAAHLWGLRRGGQWSGTHENGLALMALATFIRATEPAAPDLKVTPWLGAEPLATWQFQGRLLRPESVEVPMRRVIEAGTAPLIIAVRGTGTYYWSAALAYGAGLDAPARDQGVFLKRRVRAVADGSETAQAGRGRVVIVELTLASATDLDRLAIDCPLPAGLAPVRFDLATAPESLARALDSLPWEGEQVECTHQEFRDDRVTCFVDRLRAGVHAFRFAARAVVPGRFAFPAAVAEEMYHPETFGSSSGGQFVVE